MFPPSPPGQPSGFVSGETYPGSQEAAGTVSQDTPDPDGGWQGRVRSPCSPWGQLSVPHRPESLTYRPCFCSRHQCFVVLESAPGVRIQSPVSSSRATRSESALSQSPPTHPLPALPTSPPCLSRGVCLNDSEVPPAPPSQPQSWTDFCLLSVYILYGQAYTGDPFRSVGR